MLQHIYSELIGISQTLGEVKGDVHANTRQVQANARRIGRIEHEVREVRQMVGKGQRPPGLSDWWPAIAGLLAFALATAGKISWGEALRLVAGAGG